MQIDLYIYLAIYLIFLIGISYYVSRKQSKEDFLIAGRKRKGWQIMLSKFAASIGAAYFITYTGLAYEYGIGIFGAMVGILAGFLIFAYWVAPKIYKDSKKNKFYTIGDFIYHKTKSNFARILGDVVSNSIILSWLIVGVIGGGKIISNFGLMSYELAVLVTIVAVAAYIIAAGYESVVITDIIQSAVIFALLILVTIGITGTVGLSELFGVETQTIEPIAFIAFLLFGIFSTFSYADRYQLSYAAKTEKGLKHGLGMSIIPVVLCSFFLFLIGIFMLTKVPNLDTSLVFTEALMQYLPPKLLPISMIMFVAGIMSSADTNVYAIASHYAVNRKKDKVKSIKNSIVFILGLTGIFAILFPDIVDVTIFTAALAMTMSPSMIYLITGGTKLRKFITSVLSGIAGLAIGFAILGPEPALILCSLIFSGLGLLYRKSS